MSTSFTLSISYVHADYYKHYDKHVKNSIWFVFNENGIDTLMPLNILLACMKPKRKPPGRKHRKTGLTPKQKRFCELYPIYLNATRAAREAGYSARTANEQGSALLVNPNIRKEIATKTMKASYDANVDLGQLLTGLQWQSYYDPRKFFDEKGNALNIHELGDAEADAVEGFEFVTLYEGTGDQKHAFGQLRKMKLARKAQSRELLGRYLGIFKDSLEIKSKDKFDGRTPEELRYYAEHGEFPTKPGDRGVDSAVQGERSGNGY